MNILKENIDKEYNSKWNKIDRQLFDFIISLDFETDINNGKIGQVAEKLLLPKFLEGEKSFLRVPDQVKKAIRFYWRNKENYKGSEQYLNSYSSVKDFINFNNEYKKEDQTYWKIIKKIQDEDPTKNLFEYVVGYGNFDVIKSDYNNTRDLKSQVRFKSYFNNLLTLSTNSVPYYSNSLYNSIYYLLPRYKVNNNKDVERAWIVTSNQFKTTSIYIIYIKSKQENAYSFEIPYEFNDPSLDIYKDNDPKKIVSYFDNYFSSNSRYWTTWRQVCDFIYNNLPLFELLKKTDKDLNNSPFFNVLLIYVKSKNHEIEMNDKNHLNLRFDKLVKDWSDDQSFSEPSSDNFSRNTRIKQDNKTYSEYNFNKNTILNIKDVDLIYPAQFENLLDLEQVNFKTPVSFIGTAAFKNCKNLFKVSFKEGLKEIGIQAFYGCTSLNTDIVIPKSVEVIKRDAFENVGKNCKLICYDLNSIKIDKGNCLAIENKDLYEELEKEKLDENIPPDLARAYAKAEQAESKAPSYADSHHTDVGNIEYRRKAKWDYANSNYKVLAPAQAMWYCSRRNKDRPEHKYSENLRFIIGGKLAEPSDVVNYNYWCKLDQDDIKGKYLLNPDGTRKKVDQEFLDSKENQLRNQKGYPALNLGDDIPILYFKNALLKDSKSGLLDTKFATLVELCSVADKIYLTDEYDHPLSQDIINRRNKKDAKVIKTDKNLSQIYKDTLDLTKPESQYTNADKEQNKLASFRYIPDTGSHDFNTVKREKIETWVLAKINNYVNLLKDKKESYKKYYYCYKALKKLKSEKDYYEDLKEYDSLIKRLEESLKNIKKEYDDICLKCKAEEIRINDSWNEEEATLKGIHSYIIIKLKDKIKEKNNLLNDINLLKDMSIESRLSNELSNLYSQISSINFEDSLKDYEDKINEVKQKMRELGIDINKLDSSNDNSNITEAEYVKQKIKEYLNEFDKQVEAIYDSIDSREEELLEKRKELKALLKDEKANLLKN